MMHSDGDQDQERAALQRFAATLQGWHLTMLDYEGKLPVGSTQRFLHDTSRLLECIRFSAFLQGGPEHLVDAISRAVSLAVPAFAAGPLLHGLHESKCTKVPSASTMRRYELSFDVALILSLRSRPQRDRVYKFAHADSSPIAGYDWFWTQHKEILESAAPCCLSGDVYSRQTSGSITCTSRCGPRQHCHRTCSR